MIKKVFRWLYIFWAFTWFLIGFFLIFPLVFILIQIPKWHKYYFPLSKAWAALFYTMNFLSLKIHWEFTPDPKKVYIYCPNHFSFMDIPILTRTMPAFFVFVGLHNLKKIPLFGYMYSKIHITIDRSGMRDRYHTYQRSKEALENGKNIVIFPEGGIWAEDFPKVAPFKDGPFRLAVEQNIEIIPVTIPFNYRILPISELGKFKWHHSEIVFHKPISPVVYSVKNLKPFKEKVFQIIQSKLNEYHKI